jgi:hypothetical protein
MQIKGKIIVHMLVNTAHQGENTTNNSITVFANHPISYHENLYENCMAKGLLSHSNDPL